MDRSTCYLLQHHFRKSVISNAVKCCLMPCQNLGMDVFMGTYHQPRGVLRLAAESNRLRRCRRRAGRGWWDQVGSARKTGPRSEAAHLHEEDVGIGVQGGESIRISLPHLFKGCLRGVEAPTICQSVEDAFLELRKQNGNNKFM